MAGFKDCYVDKYIKKLQEEGYTIVVIAQDEQCANTTRSVVGIFSPGTYFSNETNAITNNCCCIWIDLISTTLMGKIKKSVKTNNNQLIYIGISNIDIYTGKTSVFEFQENYLNSPTTFDELERVISIYNPSETIIISNFSENEIEKIISYANIKSSSIHYVSLSDKTNKNSLRAYNCQKQTYHKEILERFYTITDYSSFIKKFHENTISTQALCYLLDFVFQHNPDLVKKIKEPIFENFNERLVLANHSLKQLNIIDDDKYQGKYSSVLKMLNDCVTPMGKRKFSYNFLNNYIN
jgi:DNA mismatch repair protein MutS